MNGDHATIGMDTMSAICSHPSIGEYTASPCINGDWHTLGKNTVRKACSLPEDGQFVSTICVSGFFNEVGNDAMIKNYLQANTTGQYIISECISSGNFTSVGT